MQPKQYVSTPPPPPNVIPTDPLPGGRPLPLPACDVVGLRELSASRTHPVPPKASFSVGRDLTNGIVLLDPTVSRTHAHVQRCSTHLHVLDANSTRGTIVDGRPRAVADLYPGSVARLGACELLAVNAAMEATTRDLDRIVGLPAQVGAALLALRETRVLVIQGPVGAGHRELAASLHRAGGRCPGPTWCEERLPAGDALDALVASARGGWVVLDAVDRGVHLAAAALERLLAPRDELTFVLALSDQHDLPPSLLPYRPRVITAVTMAARLRDTPVAEAIDAVLAWRDLPLRARDLHPDLVSAIGRARWPKNYLQFADVVSFIGRRLAGYDFDGAVSGLYSTAPSSVVRWVHELGVDRRLVGMRGD